MTKYIFITGGVVSSLGKGIASAAIASLLQSRGFSIRQRKMDPYLNVDPGTMSPFQHGEVFVTDDGAETDLDLGHYERFTGVSSHKSDSISGGRIYWNVLNKERKGEYLGATVQAIPHITNEVINFIKSDLHDEDFVIYEIGGTVGDMEGVLFLEGIRQFMNEVGRENVLLIHLTLVPYIKTAGEVKTKPTQQSVRTLLEKGLYPNIILCRSDNLIPENEKRKIAMFCNVKTEDVISAPDVDNIYKIPIVYHNEGLDTRILKYFDIDENKNKADISKWKDIVSTIQNLEHKVTIGIVAKYCGFADAYKSLNEAIYHAGIANKANINIKWINAEELETLNQNKIKETFSDIDGIIVAGGFGYRGVEGKIIAANYARINNIPYLGICLGMQVAVIEMARNILGIKDANSTEFTDKCTPVVSLITEWDNNGIVEKRDVDTDKGGTLRLGSYISKLERASIIRKIYNNSETITERHRHRYEINIKYEDELKKHGIIISGHSMDGKLPETIEIPSHKFFVACQFHPEFKSRPFSPAPLFDALIKVCLNSKQ